jgi:hypothetical protein
MKLTSIEIHPAGSADVAALSFRDPGSENPYNVKAITGLDLDAIVPQQYGASGGANFYDFVIESRTVVIRVQLNPRFDLHESYSDLRDALYRMISSARSGNVQLQFKNDDEVIAVVSGLIIKFETTQFEQSQEVQITIFCRDPLLKALEPESLDVSNLNPANTIINDEKSSAPHGFVFTMSLLLATASVKITDPDDTSWSFEVTPAGGFLQNDYFHFSSERGNKNLYISRGATRIYLGDVITAGSQWPIIFPGFNRFAFTNPTHFQWVDLSHTPTYWGV